MSLIACTNVTAVKLLKANIIVGIGSYVNIYERDSCNFLQRLLALKGQNIYGFVLFKELDKTIIYGGKQFTILVKRRGINYNIIKDLFEIEFDAVHCDDWLHSAVWTRDNEIALLTAHNTVQIWNISTQTLVRSYSSKNNSILYSGLLLPIQKDLLVLAGTVYSEVIVHQCGNEEALHRLKGHKGVIFWISYDFESQFIVTTSDDRSVRIWGPKHCAKEANDNINYWKNIDIECKHELYGHSARVMRSIVTKKYIVSVGEDSIICFWNKIGVLVSKKSSHQGGSIWSVDGDETHIITGGGDGGVTLHPITTVEYKHNEVLINDLGTPKKLFFTAHKNLLVLNENSELIYIDIVNKETKYNIKLKHESTFKVMSLSNCKQIIAIIDMFGNLDVYIETCKNKADIVNIINTKLNVEKVLSMHWAGNRYLVVCSENGKIKVIASKSNEIENCDDFILPNCKERWLTAAAFDESNHKFVFGDRCGNIHIYSRRVINPIKTFYKVHGRYGPTTITVKSHEIVTTGRNATVQYFHLKDDAVKLLYNKEVNFEWVEKFLDKNEKLVCGFQERDFVVTDFVSNTKLIEVPCGGGHRAWDAIRYIDKIKENYTEIITFAYVKNSTIHLQTFDLNKINPKHIISGTHTKEINCLKSLNIENQLYIFSGGEDTTLRISSLKNNQFKDEFIFKQLSSVKVLKIHELGKFNYLLVSAGGRAQICSRVIKFDTINHHHHHISQKTSAAEHRLDKVNDEVKITVEDIKDYMIKGVDKNRPCNQNWRAHTIDFDPETRIMDLEIFSLENDQTYFITVACSDAYIRIYKLVIDMKQKSTFELLNEIKYHNTCILKTSKNEIKDIPLLFTCTTRGEVAVWNVLELINNDKSNDPKPILLTNTNKSGINSIATYINRDKNELIICTGGDDNAVHLKMFKIITSADLRFIEQNTWSKENLHCAQVTGIIFTNNFVICTSIDQRITVLDFSKTDEIECRFLNQLYTDVADVKGIEIMAADRFSVTLIVFGKGFEVINVSTIR